MVLILTAVFAAAAPTPITVQRGRAFISVESHVGSAFLVAVGKVKSFEPVTYKKPDETFYPGTPYRVSFAVAEFIKGKSVSDLPLILCLQRTETLPFLRDQQTEVMLVGSQEPIDEEAELGLEPTGSHYSFRILRPLPVTEKTSPSHWIADQLNTSMNRGQMFDLNLRVLSRREDILARARSFVKKHPGVLNCGFLSVPNEFGVKCGYTNAYCGISLPLCSETRELAIRLKKDDRWILQDVVAEKRGFAQKTLQQSLLQFLGGPEKIRD